MTKERIEKELTKVRAQLETLQAKPVSYTHLTLPTKLEV